MRLAHLILAHSNPSQLERLVQRLSHANADIYIHIDKKVPIQPFLQLLNLYPNVFFVEKRIKVYWGAYSIVQATLNGFETIIASNKTYHYINLLSGQDYPIQPIDHIYNFLKYNPDKAFMEFYLVNDSWKEAIPRLTNYHLTNYHFLGKHFLQKWINRVLPSRKLPYSMTAVGRSQWFTITGEHINYIIDFLKTHPKVHRYFKLTWGADELFFQTILYNSPYKKNMVNNNLRLIDWSAGGVSPKTFNADDVQQIMQSDKLFARKFDNTSSESLLALIDRKIMPTIKDIMIVIKASIA